MALQPKMAVALMNLLPRDIDDAVPAGDSDSNMMSKLRLPEKPNAREGGATAKPKFQVEFNPRA